LRRTIISALFSFMLLATAAAALSASPASTNLNPKATYPQTFEFFMTNTENTPMSLDVAVDGNLKDYITVNSFDSVLPANGKGNVSFTVNLPKDIAPGNYKSSVLVTSSEVFGGGGMGIKIAIAHVVWFDLPYPGKHITPNLVVRTQPVNMLEVVSQAINDGTESVPSVEITTNVYSPKGEVVKTFSATQAAPANSSAIVSGRVTIDNPEKGDYKAVMEIKYDGKTVSSESKITLATTETSSVGEAAQAAVATVIGSSSSNLPVYILVAAVLVLIGYIVLKRKK